jgi:hypothetical protein
MANQTYSIPNLIQGVSQQAAPQRRDTQCESQFDCVNSPVEGAVARPGIDFVQIVEVNLYHAYFKELRRGVAEHYIVTITDLDPGGTGNLRIWNLDSGDECTVSITPGAEEYLLPVGGMVEARDVYRTATVNDTTFIANSYVQPAQSADASDPIRSEGLVWWRAGGYSTTYQLAIAYAGLLYTWTYQTPDNSVVGNAPFINTNQIAATFYRALTGGVAVPPTTGGAIGSDGPGVGASDAGSAGFVGATTATSLGFSVAINGNVLRIWRNDLATFDLDTADGQGDTHMKAVKDIAQHFTDLPRTAWPDMIIKVKGEDAAEEDDYWVRYTAYSQSNGVWEETRAPSTNAGLDNTTMPHVLLNTAVDTFAFGSELWSERIAGDDERAPDPSFVGRYIEDIFYAHNRLGILTEGTFVLSKSAYPYTFYPDTVQTILADAPIDFSVSGGKNIALMRFHVEASESTFLWAQEAQWRVFAQGNDGFRQDTVEAKQAGAFDFVEECRPLAVGSSLYFASEPGDYAHIRDIRVRDGKVQGELDVTAHVAKYIPAGVRLMTSSDTLGMLFVVTDGSETELMVYNFLTSGEQNGERLQSAWNKWRLPAGGFISWIGCHNNTLFLLMHTIGGTIFGRINLTQQQTDPEGLYLTRLDYKVTDAEVTMVFDPDEGVDGITTVTLPYTYRATDPAFLVVQRDDTDDYTRGRVWPHTRGSETDGTTLLVEGDCTAQDLYIGMTITAERTESQFFLRTEGGTVPAERITLRRFTVLHNETGYYRVEVTHANGDLKAQAFEGRVLGDAENILGPPVISTGTFSVAVDGPANKTTIRLVNDTFMPSAWQTATYEYQAAIRTSSPLRT